MGLVCGWVVDWRKGEGKDGNEILRMKDVMNQRRLQDETAMKSKSRQASQGLTKQGPEIWWDLGVEEQT